VTVSRKPWLWNVFGLSEFSSIWTLFRITKLKWTLWPGSLKDAWINLHICISTLGSSRTTWFRPVVTLYRTLTLPGMRWVWERFLNSVPPESWPWIWATSIRAFAVSRSSPIYFVITKGLFLPTTMTADMCCVFGHVTFTPVQVLPRCWIQAGSRMPVLLCNHGNAIRSLLLVTYKFTSREDVPAI
jgi:hypothetical protein